MLSDNRLSCMAQVFTVGQGNPAKDRRLSYATALKKKSLLQTYFLSSSPPVTSNFFFNISRFSFCLAAAP